MGRLNCQNQILLSRLNWKSLLPSAFCLCQTIELLIKNGLDLETFFSIMAFKTHPLIPLNSTNSMALSKIQFFSSDYVWNHISHVIISNHSNKSVNKYFINDLRQKKKFSVQYHLNLVLKMYLKVGTIPWIISCQKQTIDNQ